jgi:hypothetical protein
VIHSVHGTYRPLEPSIRNSEKEMMERDLLPSILMDPLLKYYYQLFAYVCKVICNLVADAEVDHLIDILHLLDTAVFFVRF